MVPAMSKLMQIGIALVAITAVGACKQKPAAEDDKAAVEATPSPANADTKAAAPASDHAVVGKEVTYNAGGTVLKGYLAFDESKEGKRMLAEMGYTALAVDMYGDGKQAAHPDDAKKFAMEVMGNMEEGQKRFEAAMTVLAEQPTTDPGKIAAIGYCFGGGVVLQMARAGLDLRGVASFHGMLGTEHPAEKGKVKAKVLVLHGAADPFVPEEQVEGFKKEMAAAEVPMEYHAYEGAKHAFTNPGATELGKKFQIPIEYDEAADKASWAELDGFLKRVFAD